MADAVKHPAHYTTGPIHPACGQPIECKDVTGGLPFFLGNVVKYIWRREHKGSLLEDLRKAREYLDFEIERLEQSGAADG